MNYGKIVEDSFSFAWKYKSLWIFGLFAGGGGNLNLEFGEKKFGITDEQSLEQFWELIAPIWFVLLVIALLFFILHLICSPALIDAVNKIARGGTYSFGGSYSRGIDFFLRKLGLTIVFAGSMFGIILISFVPLLIFDLFGLLILFPILFFGLFMAFSIYFLAERAMVVRDVSIGDAINEGYILFKQNFGKCVLMALINFGIAIGLFFVILMIAAMLFIPLNLFVKSISENPTIIFILAFLLGLPVSIVVGGYFGAFFHNLYTLFYFGLVDPATPYAAIPTPVAPQPTA